MKKDFRLTYAIWQMVFIVLMMLLVYVWDTSTMVVNENEIYMEFNSPFVLVLLLVILITFSIFFTQLSKHNKLFPNKKLKPLSVKPPEYVEDDEFFTTATGNATKKVYSFYTWALPLSVAFFLFVPANRLFILETICIFGFVQYFIYYREMRKLTTIEEE